MESSSANPQFAEALLGRAYFIVHNRIEQTIVQYADQLVPQILQAPNFGAWLQKARVFFGNIVIMI
jgi:hypothetical protein